MAESGNQNSNPMLSHSGTIMAFEGQTNGQTRPQHIPC